MNLNHGDNSHNPYMEINGGKRPQGVTWRKDFVAESWLMTSKHKGNKVKKKRRFRK